MQTYPSVAPNAFNQYLIGLKRRFLLETKSERHFGRSPTLSRSLEVEGRTKWIYLCLVVVESPDQSQLLAVVTQSLDINPETAQTGTGRVYSALIHVVVKRHAFRCYCLWCELRTQEPGSGAPALGLQSVARQVYEVAYQAKEGRLFNDLGDTLGDIPSAVFLVWSYLGPVPPKLYCLSQSKSSRRLCGSGLCHKHMFSSKVQSPLPRDAVCGETEPH